MSEWIRISRKMTYTGKKEIYFSQMLPIVVSPTMRHHQDMFASYGWFQKLPCQIGDARQNMQQA